MSWSDAGMAVRRAWWLPVVAAVVCGALAFLISALSPTLYASTTQLFVATTDTSTTSAAFQGGQFSQQRVASYARLINGPELAERVVDRLKLDISASKVQEGITATAIADTVLIDVLVTDQSPERAQGIADAVGSEFIALVGRLESSTSGGPSPVAVTVTDSPDLPKTPSSPMTGRNVILGALVGFLVGSGLAVLRGRLDRTVKSPAAVLECCDAPVIGAVLQDEEVAKQHIVVRSGVSRSAENYRQLRTNLQFLNVDEPPKLIMVSSAMPSEGKTTVVVNLALALADAGRRVTVVEADLRRPKVTRYLGMVGGVGLTNILAGTADVNEVVQTYGAGVLQVIAAGPTPPNPGELLASSHMKRLLEELRGSADYVLIDAPPLLPVADASGMAAMMDGVLLSVRHGRTTKEQLRQASTTLERVGAKTLGVILNIVPPNAEVASAYGYGYSYGPAGQREQP